ncbi:MAG TPA: hypothetical protein VM573_08650 [Actinomycetota bacterium]|jgi:hypothetical protein|nr:hypothetical protein [Actinomycetota bacterium]
MLLAACGGGEETPAAPAVIEGVILDIESESLGEVESFTLKDGDRTFEIFIDPEVDYGFPLSHLNEHMVSSEPVRCELEERDGKLYAQTIEDV